MKALSSRKATGGTLAFLPAEEWSQQTFGAAQLGDLRRTSRLVRLASQMAKAPQASLPQQHEGNWGQTKAAYRFLANEAISRPAISEPYWQQSRQLAAEEKRPVLFVHDDTEVDYGYDPAIADLGPVGNGSHRGLHVHTVLAVVPPQDQEPQERLLGVAYQYDWKRQKAPRRADGRKESHAQRQKRPRESQVWWQAMEAIGPTPAGCCWIEVADRYGDIWQFFATARRLGREVLVRAAQNRRLAGQGGQEAQETVSYLLETARQWASLGERMQWIASQHQRRAREARLAISWGHVRVQATNGKGSCKPEEPPLDLWIVRVWEPQPPLKVGALRKRGERRTHGARPKKRSRQAKAAPPADPERLEPLEWILICSVPVETEAEAWRCVTWYGCRWSIEEVHRGMKTGCRLQERQLADRERCERLLGIVTPIAVRLLQLRDLRESLPDAPASCLLTPLETRLLAQHRGEPSAALTVKGALDEIAHLGGFLGRHSDGRPGWVTLWRGWLQLHWMVQGVCLLDEPTALGP